MKNEYGNTKYKQIIAELKDELKKQREALKENDDQYPKIKKIIDEN